MEQHRCCTKTGGCEMVTEQKIVVEAGQGASVWLGGVGVDFKIPAAMTGGALSIVEHPLEPGRLIPPHIHYREDELSYVLRGEIGVRIGDRDYTAGPGSYVFKPRGIAHTFWNAGPEPAHLLEVIWPAGSSASSASSASSSRPARRRRFPSAARSSPAPTTTTSSTRSGCRS